MKTFKPDVLFEDNHLLVINKPAGMLVQGDSTGDAPLSELLKDWLKVKYNKPGNVYLGVSHRIDRPVSGVLLFAKTSKALARINDAFKAREMHKTYWAVVEEMPEKLEGKLSNWLAKNAKLNKSYCTKPGQKGGLKAELSYKLIGSSERYHLLEVTPKTGRHHQIRVQLSAIGCPVKGDLKYGAKRSNKDGSIHLHARRLQFTHPVTKQQMSIEAPPPHDAIWDYFKALK